MGWYGRLDRLEVAAADRVVARLQRLFHGRRWLRNAVAAALAAAVVVAFPIESALEGISRAADDD
jgi:anthranilate phosphoribosyltransferase